jgi:Outer membrane lipoprotein-sorting protein
MMHTFRVHLALACAMAIAVTAAADDPDARALVVKVRDSAPTVPLTADVTLTSGGGWVRKIKLSSKGIGDERATLLEVTSPADVAGSRYLLFERTEGSDRQFMYLPALTKRIIEVTDEARREPFLGSDFYVADLIAPDVNSFTYAFTGDEEIDGHKCRLLEATVKEGAKAPYPKTVFAVEPDTLVVWRAEAFDAKGDAFKVWTLEKLKVIDGQNTPVAQRMRNVQSKSESTLLLENVEYGANLPDSIFSKQKLSR